MSLLWISPEKLISDITLAQKSLTSTGNYCLPFSQFLAYHATSNSLSYRQLGLAKLYTMPHVKLVLISSATFPLNNNFHYFYHGKRSN